jgi:hypothetical protein
MLPEASVARSATQVKLTGAPQPVILSVKPVVALYLSHRRHWSSVMVISHKPQVVGVWGCCPALACQAGMPSKTRLMIVTAQIEIFWLEKHRSGVIRMELFKRKNFLTMFNATPSRKHAAYLVNVVIHPRGIMDGLYHRGMMRVSCRKIRRVAEVLQGMCCFDPKEFQSGRLKRCFDVTEKSLPYFCKDG